MDLETHTGTRRLAELASLLPEEASVDRDGILAIGGCRVDELAAEFGTPVYVIDEEGLRRQIRRYVDGIRRRWPRSEVLFASKSLPCVGMYAVAAREGLSVDVAGGGELHMALAAGVDPGMIYVHGNAKSDDELRMALDAGVKAVIVDNLDELARLERMATRPQQLLVRIIPGVSPDTHVSQITGGAMSKFGLPLDQVEQVVARVERHPLLHLSGLHLHIGSQVLQTLPFAQAVQAIAALGDRKSVV